MAVRFVTGWRRFLPSVGYHHLLMILIAIAIVLLCEFRPAVMVADGRKGVY